MPLSGTEDALADALYAAATGSEGDPKEAWKKVAKALTSHITANAVVTGVAPNGPVTNGRVT